MNQKHKIFNQFDIAIHLIEKMKIQKFMFNLIIHEYISYEHSLIFRMYTDSLQLLQIHISIRKYKQMHSILTGN